MARREKAAALQTEISMSEVSKRIYTLRQRQIMFDTDLADVYQVETRVLKRAVRSNIGRFPDDFMFEPSQDELESLRSKTVTSSVKNHSEAHLTPSLRSKFWISNIEGDLRGRGGSRYTPFVFTESGVAMLSSVLHSERAIQVNIAIMRVFIELRKQKLAQAESPSKMESLTKDFDVLKQRVEQLESRVKNETTSTTYRSKPASKYHPVNFIQNAVAEHFGVSSEDLKSASRIQGISLPRQIAIYLARKNLCMSFSDIGRHFGGRDHTTVLHAYRKILSDAETNTMIRTAVSVLGSETYPRLA